jgi:hypothetical protein
MASPQVSLLPLSRNAAHQAPPSESRVPLSGKSPIELVFPALTTTVGADPEETPSHEAVRLQLFSTEREGLPEVLMNSEPSQQKPQHQVPILILEKTLSSLI